jgi:hypothetical protein
MGQACDYFWRDAIKHDWCLQQRRYFSEVDLMGNDSDERESEPAKPLSGSNDQADQARCKIRAQLAAIQERLAQLRVAARFNSNVQGTIQQLLLQQKRLAAQLAQSNAKATQIRQAQAV